MLWDEAALVHERLNAFEVTRGVLLRDAVSSLFSKDGQKVFRDQIEQLNSTATSAKESDDGGDGYTGPSPEALIPKA